VIEPVYVVSRAGVRPEGAGLWDGPSWGPIASLEVAHFHARSSVHRPVTRVKLQHDDDRLFALFVVNDRFVRSVHTEYESDTYKDSCVELFLQPDERRGYLALEVNCGGTISFRHIEDWTRTPDRFARWRPVEARAAARVEVARSMPTVVEPELSVPVDWWIELAVPLDVIEAHFGSVRPLGGRSWRANVFKCGDETSHPHWASWAPIGEALNFHQPQYFGTFCFASDPARS